MPVIEWNDPEVNITEGDNMQICFTSDIGSDVPYEVRVGVSPKGASSATRGNNTICIVNFYVCLYSVSIKYV